MPPEGGAEGVVIVVVAMAGVATVTLVTRGPLPLLPVVLEAAAPAAHPTQHTHIMTIAMGTMMNSTIPATVTPTMRPTRLTAWKEYSGADSGYTVISLLFPVYRMKIIFMKILGHEFLACMQLQVLC